MSANGENFAPSYLRFNPNGEPSTVLRRAHTIRSFSRRLRSINLILTPGAVADLATLFPISVRYLSKYQYIHAKGVFKTWRLNDKLQPASPPFGS